MCHLIKIIPLYIPKLYVSEYHQTSSLLQKVSYGSCFILYYFNLLAELSPESLIKPQIQLCPK